MRTLLLTAAIALLTSIPQSAPNKPGPTENATLTMSIAPSDSLTAGHQITLLTVTFTNTSANTVTFAPGTTVLCGVRPSKTSGVVLNLTDPKGKLHRMYYKGDGPPYSGGYGGQILLFIVTLRPHESIALPLDLSKYVDLTDAKQFEMTRFPAGTYSVQAEFQSEWRSPQQYKKTTWLGTLKPYIELRRLTPRSSLL